MWATANGQYPENSYITGTTLSNTVHLWPHGSHVIDSAGCVVRCLIYQAGGTESYLYCMRYWMDTGWTLHTTIGYAHTRTYAPARNAYYHIPPN